MLALVVVVVDGAVVVARAVVMVGRTVVATVARAVEGVVSRVVEGSEVVGAVVVVPLPGPSSFLPSCAAARTISTSRATAPSSPRTRGQLFRGGRGGGPPGGGRGGGPTGGGGGGTIGMATVSVTDGSRGGRRGSTRSACQTRGREAPGCGGGQFLPLPPPPFPRPGSGVTAPVVAEPLALVVVGAAAGTVTVGTVVVGTIEVVESDGSSPAGAGGEAGESRPARARSERASATRAARPSRPSTRGVRSRLGGVSGGIGPGSDGSGGMAAVVGGTAGATTVSTTGRGWVSAIALSTAHSLPEPAGVDTRRHQESCSAGFLGQAEVVDAGVGGGGSGLRHTGALERLVGAFESVSDGLGGRGDAGGGRIGPGAEAAHLGPDRAGRSQQSVEGALGVPPGYVVIATVAVTVAVTVTATATATATVARQGRSPAATQ